MSCHDWKIDQTDVPPMLSNYIVTLYSGGSNVTTYKTRFACRLHKSSCTLSHSPVPPQGYGNYLHRLLESNIVKATIGVHGYQRKQCSQKIFLTNKFQCSRCHEDGQQLNENRELLSSLANYRERRCRAPVSRSPKLIRAGQPDAKSATKSKGMEAT